MSSVKITITHQLVLSDVPPPLAKTLEANLAFTNPKWKENERMGRWNKHTPKTLQFYDRTPEGDWVAPRGYLREIILLCREYKIDYHLDDRRRRLEPRSIRFTGRLKPFQQLAVDWMLTKDFGTLCAPTGSGKTVMALYMIAKRRQPALIVVHTKDLAAQWIDRIHQFLDVTEEDVGMIGDGKFAIGHQVTVALVQSLYKRADQVARQVGFLIVDECHRCPSRTFTEAVTQFDAAFMLGLSATPRRRDDLTKLIFWHLGVIHYTINQGGLIESGDVLAVEPVFRKTDFKPFCDPAADYSRMLTELTSDDARNRLIAADVAQEVADHPDGVCLVLSDRKHHCHTLQALLKLKFQVAADVLTGDLSMDQRREVLDRINTGQTHVLVATGQLIGEGFDCKALSTLFLTTPVRFEGRVRQYLGRILRPAEGKTKARVFDYVDIHVGPLLKAANERQRIYGMAGQSRQVIS